MDYWAETMQDDVYLHRQRRLARSRQARLIVEDKDKKTKEKPDFTVGKPKFKADLIPAALVIARYFAAEQAAIEKLEAEAAAIDAADGGNGRGARRRGRTAGRGEERQGQAHQSVGHGAAQGDQGRCGRRGRAQGAEGLPRPDRKGSRRQRAGEGGAEGAGWPRSRRKYGKLTEDEIKTLVVDDKWLAALAAAVQGELDRVSQTLTGRIRQLAERYATPLPQLTGEVETLAARVDEHLKKMGAVWN